MLILRFWVLTTFVFQLINVDDSLNPCNLTQNHIQNSFFEQPCEKNNKSSSFTIVIDPGHGGVDNGCSVHNCKEKDVTLPFAMLLGKTIRGLDNNIQIVFTRQWDKKVPLDERIQIANAAQADLFISIHANSVSQKHVRGFETYIYGEPVNETPSHLNQIEELVEVDLVEEHNHSNFIIEQIKRNSILNSSIELAKQIDKEVASLDTYKSRGLKQARFRVLKKISTPSVLLELGYLTNKHDAQVLNTKAGQSKLSDKVAAGILTYLYQSSQLY